MEYKKLIIFTILGILVLGIVGAISFSIKNDFTIKVNTLDSNQLCLKDSSLKIVKDSQCEKEKPKYSIIDISATNLFYKNSDNIVRFANE